jgi:Replicase family
MIPSINTAGRDCNGWRSTLVVVFVSPDWPQAWRLALRKSLHPTTRSIGGTPIELQASPPCGLRQAFPGLIPARPYCADALSDGLRIRKKKLALECRHIQLNGPATFRWMLHDIDYPGAYNAHDDVNLPPPNFIAINPANGHGHSAVLLAMPVARHDAARIKPLHFYSAVERGIARRLCADRYYAGLITKNPVHDHWRVEWRRDCPNWPNGYSPRTCSPTGEWKKRSAPAATAPCSTSCG